MILRHAIIHEIIKDKVEKGVPQKAPVIDWGELLDVKSESIINFIDSIRKIYGTKDNNSSSGTFEKTDKAERVFSTELDDYLEFDAVDDDEEKAAFKQLSHQTMIRLKDKIDGNNFATGGYIVFGHYVPENRDFDSTGMLLITMVKNKNGIRLVNLVPTATQTVDLSKLHQAVRVDIEKYVNWIDSNDPDEEQFQAYLTFISPKASEKTTGYFIKAIGCSNAYSNRVATNSVIRAVKDFFKQDDRMKELNREAKEIIATKLYELSQNKDEDKKICTLDTLDHWVNSILPDECLPGFENKFSEFANKEPYNVPASFVSNASAAKESMKLKIDAKGWKMDFDKKLLGLDENATIYFDEKNGRIVINHVPENVSKVILGEFEPKNEDKVD